MSSIAKLTTPAGVAQYPRVNSPDYGSGEYKNEHGIYRVNLSVPKAAMKAFKAAWDEANTAAKAMGKCKKMNKDPQVFEEVDDQGAKTGNWVIKASMKNVFNKDKGEVWDRKPAIFDSKGKVSQALVGSGSEMKCAVEFFGYNRPDGYGVRINLFAVQIIKLVKYTGKTAGGYGFSEEEEGYEASEDHEEDGEQATMADDNEGSDEDLF